jgi:hypothetical protein
MDPVCAFPGSHGDLADEGSEQGACPVPDRVVERDVKLRDFRHPSVIVQWMALAQNTALHASVTWLR